MILPLIALLTDFGSDDLYVGVMNGVILGIAPQARLVDITHAIQPQNVRQAAFALLNSYPYFPSGAIFLVVVDPGVGSLRRPIAAQAGGCTFVAPDNGVLSYVLHLAPPSAVVELANPAYRLPQVSHTFHGRDVFAPAAAHLAAGVPLDALGNPITDPVTLPLPVLRVEANRIAGEVLHVDRFGNVITSIGALGWESNDRLILAPRFDPSAAPVRMNAAQVAVSAGQRRLSGIRHAYSEVAPGDLLAMVDSNGYLELAVNQGSAAARLNLSVGEAVEISLA